MLSVLHPHSPIAISASNSLAVNGVDGTFDCALLARDMGFTNITPHLAARSVQSPAHLQELMGKAAAADVKEIFVIGGDVTRHNKLIYPDSFAVLEAITADHPGVISKVGIAGYPNGHPNPAINNELTADLKRKQALADEFKEGMVIETQFDFDALAVMRWIYAARRDDIHLPIRVGLLGAVGYKRSLQSMKLMSGPIEVAAFMNSMNISKLGLALKQHIPKTIRLAQAFSVMGGDIEGFVVNTLNDTATVKKYERVYDAARMIQKQPTSLSATTLG